MDWTEYEHHESNRDRGQAKRDQPLKRKSRPSASQSKRKRLQSNAKHRAHDRRMSGVDGVTERLAIDIDRRVILAARALFTLYRTHQIVSDGTKRNTYSAVYDFETGEVSRSHTLGLGLEVWTMTDRALRSQKKHNTKLQGFWCPSTASRIHKVANDLRKALKAEGATDTETEDILSEVAVSFHSLSDAKLDASHRYGLTGF